MQTQIMLLENAVHYFIDYVLILLEPGAYRLVVVADGGKRIDKHYNTIRGAKTAFLRSFKHRALERFSKPKWSHCFPPGKQWLQDRLNGVPLDLDFT